MSPKSVMVVDDDSKILGIVRQTLKRDGWQVYEATSLEAAWDLWQWLEKKPSIALLDLNIADREDGLTLARELKASDPKLKVVIVSGLFSDQNIYPNQFYYVDKPFKISELLILCNGLLKMEQTKCESGDN